MWLPVSGRMDNLSCWTFSVNDLIPLPKVKSYREQLLECKGIRRKIVCQSVVPLANYLQIKKIQSTLEERVREQEEKK